MSHFEFSVYDCLRKPSGHNVKFSLTIFYWLTSSDKELIFQNPSWSHSLVSNLSAALWSPWLIIKQVAPDQRDINLIQYMLKLNYQVYQKLSFKRESLVKKYQWEHHRNINTYHHTNDNKNLRKVNYWTFLDSNQNSKILFELSNHNNCIKYFNLIINLTILVLLFWLFVSWRFLIGSVTLKKVKILYRF